MYFTIRRGWPLQTFLNCSNPIIQKSKITLLFLFGIGFIPKYENIFMSNYN